MSGVTQDVKKLFNYKYKARDDCLSDQYSRLFMTKVMIIAASLTGMTWYSDEINCLVPGLAGKAIGKFSGKACWINGFYIYDELRHAENCDGYFGMPANSIHNGTLPSTACGTCVDYGDNTECKAMEKKFYIQYQWYPFFLAALALLYYAPYFLYHIANDDIKNLKVEIKKYDADVDLIVKTYFNPHDLFKVKLQRRNIILNVVIKCSYLIANIVAFLLCDSSLYGDFRNFGLKWLKWSEVAGRNNYVDRRSILDPGDMLLPTFGFCDVLEEGLDIKNILINEHKFVCEISQHIMYHYVLMTLWFFMVIGICISVFGVVNLLVRYALWKVTLDDKEVKSKAVHKHITVRQGEYLIFIRKKNEMLYGKVLDNLYEQFKIDPNRIGNHVGYDAKSL